MFIYWILVVMLMGKEGKALENLTVTGWDEIGQVPEMELNEDAIQICESKLKFVTLPTIFAQGQLLSKPIRRFRVLSQRLTFTLNAYVCEGKQIDKSNRTHPVNQIDCFRRIQERREVILLSIFYFPKNIITSLLIRNLTWTNTTRICVCSVGV